MAANYYSYPPQTYHDNDYVDYPQQPQQSQPQLQQQQYYPPQSQSYEYDSPPPQQHEQYLSTQPENFDLDPQASAIAGGPYGQPQRGVLRKLLDSFRSPVTISFMATVLIQAIVVLTMISLVYGKISGQILHDNLQLRTIKLYLAFFIFAEVYGVGMTVDAMREKNIISSVGVIIFLFAMMIYGSLMGSQVHDVLRQANSGHICPDAITCFAQNELFPNIRSYIIVIPCMLAAACVVMGGMTWLLYKEFGWSHFKLLGADLKVRDMYFWYQVYVTFLKFDIVFFFGFSLQFIILVLQSSSDAEFGITIAALPITILLLLLAAAAVRFENKYLVWLIFAGEIAGLVYFIYKIIRLFNSENDVRYSTSRKTLGVFSILSLLMLVATLSLTIKTYMNFDKGLGHHMPRQWLGVKFGKPTIKQRPSSVTAEKLTSSTTPALYSDQGRPQID